jgi:hypothetical protein
MGMPVDAASQHALVRCGTAKACRCVWHGRAFWHLGCEDMQPS